MRYIYYSVKNKDNKWTGFLQASYEANERGNAGDVKWLDPTKQTFDTEQEADNAAIKLAEDGGLVENFVYAEETDYRAGVVEIACNDAGDDEQDRQYAASIAEASERKRVSIALNT